MRTLDQAKIKVPTHIRNSGNAPKHYFEIMVKELNENEFNKLFGEYAKYDSFLFYSNQPDFIAYLEKLLDDRAFSLPEFGRRQLTDSEIREEIATDKKFSNLAGHYSGRLDKIPDELLQIAKKTKTKYWRVSSDEVQITAGENLDFLRSLYPEQLPSFDCNHPLEVLFEASQSGEVAGLTNEHYPDTFAFLSWPKFVQGALENITFDDIIQGTQEISPQHNVNTHECCRSDL